MNEDKIKELEARIAEVKAHWPKHSVPPKMFWELEELEEQLEAAKGGQGPD